VIGTRPEAIKMQPVAHALRNCGVSPTLVFTAQHAALDPAAFGLDCFPRIDLRCAGRENPHLHVQDVTQAMSPLLRNAPDLPVVRGDTSSALCAALAGFTAGIPVAHVEAGLRTHDPHLPWPAWCYGRRPSGPRRSAQARRPLSEPGPPTSSPKRGGCSTILRCARR